MFGKQTPVHCRLFFNVILCNRAPSEEILSLVSDLNE